MTKPSHKVGAKLGAAVLRHLSTYASLPATGLVAGQAVSSAVLDVLGEKGGGVYNDIDIFFAAREDDSGKISPDADYHEQTTFPVKPFYTDKPLFAFEPGLDNYGHFNINWVGLYRVIASRRDGMLNYIACDFDRYSASYPLQERLLRGFDLNCVQVGVDLENGELFCTQAFREFVDTKQLKVTSLHTPCHTAIRFVRKLDELKVYGNVEQAMALTALPTVFNYDESSKAHPTRLLKPWTRTDRAFYFGDKFQHTYEKYAELLGPYFRMEKHPETSWLCTLRALNMPSEELLDALRKSPRLDDAAFLFATSVVYEPHRASVLARVPEVWGGKSWLKWCMEHYGPAYLQGNIARSDIREVDKFVLRHRQLPLYRIPTFTDCLRAVRLLKKLEKTIGLWVVGCVETEEVKLFTTDVGPGVMRDEAELEQAFLALFPTMHMQLQTRSIKTKRVLGCKVKQLLSRDELVKEGEALHHCVGGYARLLKGGDDVIVSIVGGPTKRQRATAHLVKAPAGNWYVHSVLSFANQPATARCQAVARKLAGQLSDQSVGRLAYIKAELLYKLGPAIQWAEYRKCQLKDRLRRMVKNPRQYLFPDPNRYASGTGFDDFDDDSPF